MSKFETDVSLINSSADSYLEQWEAGKDVAFGIGMGSRTPHSELLRHVSKSYTDFNRETFDDFAKVVIQNTTGAKTEQFVQHIQVGYSKAGFMLMATVYALKPLNKRISSTRS